jgi:hypothetical protein
VDDAFAIPLEFRSKIMGLFGMFATQTFFAFGGIAGKESGFFLLPVLSGSDRHSSGMKMRDGKSRGPKKPSTKDVNSGWIGEDKCWRELMQFERKACGWEGLARAVRTTAPTGEPVAE